MKLFTIKVESDYRNILSEGKRSVSKVEYHEIERYKFEPDKVRKLLSIQLIKYIAKIEFGLEEYLLKKNRYGKPFFDELINYNFNISHSGDWVLGVSSGNLIGVDIETIKPMDNLIDISKRFFSKKEFAYIKNQSIDSQINIFFEIWAKKESFVKAVGRGISLSLGSFTVPLTSTDSNTIAYQGDSWTFTYLSNFDKKYSACVCEKSDKNRKLEIVKLGVEDLFNHF